MLVQVLSLGSNWWARSPAGARPERRVYYNSTGVRCGRKMRRHWIIPGLLRFNGKCFDPEQTAEPHRSTFVSSELSYAFGGNRLLFESRDSDRARPDCYLVTVSSQAHGAIDFCSNVWRSIFTQVIAVSQLREQQEAMLLMAAGDWLLTSAGFWQLHVPAGSHQAAQLLCTAPPRGEKDPL